MSISAIIAMVFSMTVLWGVATLVFIVSIRREDAKTRLEQAQGGYEPFSPRAARELEAELATVDPNSDYGRELQACQAEQRRALETYAQRLYE